MWVYFEKAIRTICTRASFAICLIALVFVSACVNGPMGPQTTQTNREGDLSRVKVALLLPYSASDAQVVALAQAAENAARLAIADLGDTLTVELSPYDTMGSEAGAASSAMRAVLEGAEVIIGPLYGSSARAAGQAIRGQGVPILSLSNNQEIAGENVYILGSSFQNTANRLVDYALNQGKKRAMVVHAQNAAGIAGRDAINGAFERRGTSAVGDTAYIFTQQGVVDAMPLAAAKADQTGADIIFLTDDFDGALATIAQLLPEAGVNPATVQYAGLSRWDALPSAFNLAGVQGGWFAVPDPLRTSQFNTRYRAAYGKTPHPIAAIAYDGMAMIGALAATGDPRAFSKSSLTRSSGFQGANGVFRLKSDGTNQRALAIASIKGLEVQIIDPAPERFVFGGV